MHNHCTGPLSQQEPIQYILTCVFSHQSRLAFVPTCGRLAASPYMMLDRQPAQRFPRSSLFPSLSSARLSLRHSLSRKRRRGAKQLQPAVPLTPIPEVASRKVTPTPPETTATATATSSSAYTSGVTTGFSTIATSPQKAATTSPTEPDDAAASSPPISPLTPAAGLEVATSSTQPPSPPTSPAAWWLNLPYPTATTTPLPILNAESAPWDPRANWRSSYVPVLKAWETYLARHIGAFSPGLTLSLHIPPTPPPGRQEEGEGAPRLPSPSSAPSPLLVDEDIRWSSTGSPLPPVVPAKEHHHHHAFPPAPPAVLVPEAGLEVYAPPSPLHHHQPQPPPLREPPPSILIPGTFPPSPTPSEPPSPRSSPVEALSPFPSPPPPMQDEHDLPEVVPLEQEGGLHVAFALPSSPRPSSPERQGARRRVRRASSFPPTIPIESTPETRAMYSPARSPSPSPPREKRKKMGKGPVTAVRVKMSRWEKVKAKVARGVRRTKGEEWDYETSSREEGKEAGKGRLRIVWAAVRGRVGKGKGKGG